MAETDGEVPAASDKGWAWIVLAAAFVNTTLISGYVHGVGVFLVEWQAAFGVTAIEAGWAAVIVGSCSYTGVCIGGALATKFTCQKIMVLAGLVIAISLIAGSFTSTFWQLYVTNIITALCSGICFVQGWTAIGYNFSKWLGLANGVSAAGVGMGIVVMPPLYQLLSDKLGWRSAFRIAAGLMAMCSICGILTKATETEHFLIKLRKNNRKAENDDRHRRLNLMQKLVIKPANILTDTLGIKLLFKSPRLLVVCAAQFLVGYSTYSGIVFFQSKVVFDNGIPGQQASFLASAIGVGSVVGRISSGFLVEVKPLTPRVLYGLANICCSLFGFTNPFLSTYPMLMAISIWFGLFSGVSNSMVVYCSRLCVLPQEVSSSIGIMVFVEGLGVLLGVFLTGVVRDLTDNYSVSFIIGGSVFFIAGLVVLGGNLHITLKERKQNAGRYKNGIRGNHHETTPDGDKTVVTNEGDISMGRLQCPHSEIKYNESRVNNHGIINLGHESDEARLDTTVKGERVNNMGHRHIEEMKDEK